MTLKAFFSAYTLTSGQSALLDDLENFLSNDSNCFLLKGYAGTGKTFMTQGLTNFLVNSRREFRIAAPTGRAARIISRKTKLNAYTIHKTIYSTKDLKEYKTEDEDGTESFKFFYELRNNSDAADTVYIVDEASMLSDVYSESEFFRFGSGFLLRDLLEYIDFNNYNNRKLIFIGDDAQLPPVNMSFSPATSAEYLQANYGLTPKQFELTEVLRQKSESGILYNAGRIRDSLKANLYNKIDINVNFEDIHTFEHEDFLKKYLRTCNNTIDEETIVIAYSNADVRQYNDLIRTHFFPDKPHITEGDKILLVNNNYNHVIELLNGDFGMIKEVSEKQETRTTTLKIADKDKKTREIPVSVSYKDVKIEFKDIDGKPHIISCKITENILYSSHRDISPYEQKAMYIDFWIRNPKLNQIRQLLYAKSTNYDKLNELISQLSPEEITADAMKKIKWLQKEYFQQPDAQRIREISIFILKDALRSDPYFNALRIKFGYAVTCHKAQGGEWNNVFLNCRTNMGYLNASYFRWLYTGITRSKENLFVVNTPHFTIDSNLRPPKVDNVSLNQDIIILNNELLEQEMPFDFSEQESAIRNIYLAITEYLKDENVLIDTIRHTKYLEHYTFIRGIDKATFKVHYNGQYKITRIEKPVDDTEFIRDIFLKLTPLQHKTIIIEEQEFLQPPVVFEFKQPFMKEFYDIISTKLATANLHITKIEHQQYHEIYEIKKNGHTATYKFWYDGKNIFTRTEIIPARTTGLTDEINALLSK
ncbi:UvrD-like helicase C-terminal domain-containing protein [Chitinophaga sp. YR627]|uniref:ATP-dependent DNA helicase n=1 Tax=Chitinophaga sp. YR627 TaxID=1881041 RepID=UPI0008E8993C|nr:AAA family ATPase [Chitinophaga sp. YR627]SFM97413.1 UvrD-like helicase C-terminal domain-containing protein [Chitinophaga sp. YR627]